MGADAARVLGALPANLGFTGEGAQSQIFQTPQPEGQVPTSGGQVPTGAGQTQIVVGSEPAVSVTTPTVFEFSRPYVVTSTTNLLILEHADGQVKQVDVSGIETTACAIDLRRLDASGNPTHALACPASDNVTFALSQVSLPADWPQLPAGLMPQVSVARPEGSGGGGGNWLIGGDVSGQCLKGELTRLGFENSTQFGTDWLPAGTTWMLSYPGWWSAAFTFAGNEIWNLQSRDWNWLVFDVNGVLARSMGPKADVSTVFGTGPVPEACR
ncbi:MAG: hypothetical protein HY050_03880 [Actinobacteria bacterium]|nr:hypothetical protein [Actinomycetota bacterium]